MFGGWMVNRGYSSFKMLAKLFLSCQPTGGVILLTDTRPDEPHDLLELKARKKATPSAPQPGGSGRPQTPGGVGEMRETGAAAAAGVLTAVDEDEGEEAPVPEAFDVDEDEDEEMGE